MSFSGDVKRELAENASRARHCMIAEFAALFMVSGRIRHKNDNVYLEICTENLTVAKKSYILLKAAFFIKLEIRIQNHRQHTSTVSYRLLVLEHKSVMAILKAIKLVNEQGSIWGDVSGVHSVIVQNTCCKRAFLRGAFMAAGSVTDPEKAYHLEMAVLSEKFANQLKDIVSCFGIDAKIVSRKKYYVVYVKEGAQIVDFLNVIGAHKALMGYENVRIVKEVRNSVNRQVNCETANISKTVAAATKQIEDIEYIQNYMGFGKLTDGLREIAELRLEYPDYSLKELGELLSCPISKSGVNHRLRKLSTIADHLRETGSPRQTRR